MTSEQELTLAIREAIQESGRLIAGAVLLAELTRLGRPDTKAVVKAVQQLEATLNSEQ